MILSYIFSGVDTNVIGAMLGIFLSDYNIINLVICYPSLTHTKINHRLWEKQAQHEINN